MCQADLMSGASRNRKRRVRFSRASQARIPQRNETQMCALSAGNWPKSARSKKVQDKGPTAVLAVCHPQSPAMRVFFAFCKDAPNDRFLEANVHMEELNLTVARHCGVFKQSVVKTLVVKGKTATRHKICAALNKEKGDCRGRILFCRWQKPASHSSGRRPMPAPRLLLFAGRCPTPCFFLTF